MTKNKEMQGGHHQHLLLLQKGQASRSASTPGRGSQKDFVPGQGARQHLPPLSSSTRGDHAAVPASAGLSRLSQLQQKK